MPSDSTYSDDFDLSGKSAVVTGSSRGIGRQIALRLAAAGANCLVHTRQRVQSAEQVADEIRALGVDSTVCQADVTNQQEQDKLCEAAFHWRDPIDIWVNNAGADVLTGDAANWSFESKLEMLWKVDVLGTIRMSRFVGSRMRSSGSGGVILNMGWDQAEIGMEGESGEMFAAVKGAIMAFSKSLAKSLAPEVRVNCLAPGWIRTAWGAEASDFWQQRAVRESLLGRWGTPDDVARVAHFLVSPAASFLTGQIVPINGGLATASGARHD